MVMSCQNRKLNNNMNIEANITKNLKTSWAAPKKMIITFKQLNPKNLKKKIFLNLTELKQKKVKIIK